MINIIIIIIISDIPDERAASVFRTGVRQTQKGT